MGEEDTGVPAGKLGPDTGFLNTEDTESAEQKEHRKKEGGFWPPQGRLDVSGARACATGQLALTKWPRRFFCQQSSLDSMQKGFFLPKLTVGIRSAAMPKETR